MDIYAVRTSQPGFYAAYRDNRKVTETGRAFISLTATITDAGTKAGIKSLPAGSYTAVMNKPGYREMVVPVTVTESETTELAVEMERG